MPLPSWDPSYETGNAAIDKQHKELLALVTDLQAMDLDALDQKTNLKMLDRVMGFTLTHFDMEEDLMTIAHYPAEDHAEMTEQHREFVSYARLRVLEFRFGEAKSMASFVPFLRSWLIDHEFGLDRKLAAFLRVSGQNAK